MTELTKKVCSKCKEEKSIDNFTRYKDRHQSYCKACRKELNAQVLRDDPKKRMASIKKSCQKVREEVLAAYGNKCECCGEDHREFLTIDHTNGGGNQHRKEFYNLYGFYRFLKKNGFPKDEFRCLCMNCNWARGIYGYCPHEKERQPDKEIRTETLHNL